MINQNTDDSIVSNFKLPSEYQSGNTIHVSSPGARGARGDRKNIMSHQI
jgi:hypothetical protein